MSRPTQSSQDSRRCPATVNKLSAHSLTLETLELRRRKKIGVIPRATIPIDRSSGSSAVASINDRILSSLSNDGSARRSCRIESGREAKVGGGDISPYECDADLFRRSKMKASCHLSTAAKKLARVVGG